MAPSNAMEIYMIIRSDIKRSLTELLHLYTEPSVIDSGDNLNNLVTKLDVPDYSIAYLRYAVCVRRLLDMNPNLYEYVRAIVNAMPLLTDPSVLDALRLPHDIKATDLILHIAKYNPPITLFTPTVEYVHLNSRNSLELWHHDL